MDTQENVQSQPQPIGGQNPTEVTKKDKVLITTIVIILLIIAAMAVAGFLFIQPGPDTVQGQGEATELRISGKLPGRVAEIYVEEGESVKAGDTLVRITSTLVDAKLIQAQALEKAAAATNRGVDAGARKQVIDAARDLWTQASAAAGITQKTYQRMQNLYAQGVVSEQKRDEAKAAYDAAKAAESAARSQYDLARSGARLEEKEASAAMVKVAQGGVNEVNALLEDQYLTAPVDGEITEIYPNVSELIATGAPIMSIQTPDRWVVFSLRENMLKDIKVGSKVKVYIPALEKTVDMKVFYIKDMGTYANWQATKATGSYDARTFQIKARPEKPIENFRPGMSAVLKK